MKLHFHPASTASRPVVLFCAEEKIAYEPVVVDIMTGEHMKDEGLVLSESSAILRPSPRRGSR